MRRIKQWEEEKSVLEEGLMSIKEAQDLYTERLQTVLNRLKFGPESGSAHHSEARQERLNFELQSISELNQRIKRLAEPNARFPTHINLQIGNSSPVNVDTQILERQVCRLKDQNKMLTEEIGRKSTHIANLEQEKGALIKQLFQARNPISGGGSTMALKKTNSDASFM